MKKILVTGSFEGAVVVMYGEPGIGVDALPGLMGVELSGACLTDKQKEYLMNCIPLRYGPGYEGEWGVMTGRVQIVTEDYELEFERDFFEPYGKPVNKARCLKWWGNMNRAKWARAVAGIGPYKRFLGRNQWRTKADPETYLKKEMYLTNWDNME